MNQLFCPPSRTHLTTDSQAAQIRFLQRKRRKRKEKIFRSRKKKYEKTMTMWWGGIACSILMHTKKHVWLHRATRFCHYIHRGTTLRIRNMCIFIFVQTARAISALVTVAVRWREQWTQKPIFALRLLMVFQYFSCAIYAQWKTIEMKEGWREEGIWYKSEWMDDVAKNAGASPPPPTQNRFFFD